jgi:hypothetical protein
MVGDRKGSARGFYHSQHGELHRASRRHTPKFSQLGMKKFNRDFPAPETVIWRKSPTAANKSLA